MRSQTTWQKEWKILKYAWKHFHKETRADEEKAILEEIAAQLKEDMNTHIETR